jgi:ubiquitin-conjugating enzyme E2 T
MTAVNINPALASRMKKELRQLTTDPGPGISAWLTNESDVRSLEAAILGPVGSPYEGGNFSLSVQLPNSYPFEHPIVRFITPIYHPNIDGEGRICLDILKNNWSPGLNINNMLLQIRMLMESPNGQDGLVAEITEEFNRDISMWRRKAAEFTRKHAVASVSFQDAKSDSHLHRETEPLMQKAAGVATDNVIENDKDMPGSSENANVRSDDETDSDNDHVSDINGEHESEWEKVTSNKRIQKLFDYLQKAKRLRNR